MTTVKSLMKKPVAILRSSTISEVLKKLLEFNISRVIIKEDNKAIGIITEKDLGFFLFQEKSRQSLDRISLDRILKKIEYVEDAEPIPNCAKIMVDKKISSLSVGNEDNLEGIFTKTDLTGYFANNFENKAKVSDYMTEEYVSTHFSASLAHVIEKMLEHKVSRLVAINQDNIPAGVVSLRDFFRIALTLGSEDDDVGAYAFSDKVRDGFLSESGFGGAAFARDVMSKDLVSIKSSEDLATACKSLIENGVNGLGVLDDKGKVSGIISKTDIMRALATMK